MSPKSPGLSTWPPSLFRATYPYPQRWSCRWWLRAANPYVPPTGAACEERVRSMLWGAVKEDPVIGWGSGVEEVVVGG